MKIKMMHLVDINTGQIVELEVPYDAYMAEKLERITEMAKRSAETFTHMMRTDDDGLFDTD